jgi:hypothetical protein
MFWGFCFSQDSGYIKFDSQETWIIEINDTLITSNEVLKINSGTYAFSARPQISYSWPAVYNEGKISVSTNDTTHFTLSKDKSVADNVALNTSLPKTTSYKDLDYHPQSYQYPKLKTGLLITSVAANWLAFYLKRQADNNYRKYGRASSISELNKYYDLAGDFDTASTVMLSISATALAGYIYIALTE